MSNTPKKLWKWFKNSVIYVLARALMGLVRLFSFSRSLKFGRWLGRTAYRLAWKPRQHTLLNLAIAFPKQSERERQELARRIFEHLGMALAEVVNIKKMGDIRQYVLMAQASKHVMDEVMARGRGMVYVTGHCGNWELMARGVVLHGYPVHSIGKQSYDPRFTRLIEQLREEGGIHTIWRGDPEIIDKMVGVIRQKEVMGFLIDQDTRVPGVFVPFFGKLAFTPSAPAMLARKMRAPMVTGFIFRRPEGGYQIEVEELKPCDEPDFEKAVIQDTAALTKRIEDHVRAHPDEWVWMHRRWKTRPEGE